MAKYGKYGKVDRRWGMMEYLQGLMMYGVKDEDADPDRIVLNKLAYWNLVNRLVDENEDDFIEYIESRWEDDELKDEPDAKKWYRLYTQFVGCMIDKMGGQDAYQKWCMERADQAMNLAIDMINNGLIKKVEMPKPSMN